MSAPDAPGTISRERLAMALRLITQDLQVDVSAMPKIVVMHATARDAAAAGMPVAGVRHNSGVNGSSNYYEFWIVGRPRSAECAVGLYTIVEDFMGQKLPQSERLAVMGRALRYLNATLSAMGE